MMNSFAVDTNIFLYLRNTDSPEKQRKANNLIDLSPVVSSQVISEYLNPNYALEKYLVIICCNSSIYTHFFLMRSIRKKAV